MPFWTYILHCRGGVFYTGHTDNLDNRIADHHTGRFEGFTKRYLPVELVWSQDFVTRDEAKAAEKQIKGWSRAKKLALIRGDWGRVSVLAKSKGNRRADGPASLPTTSGWTELGDSEGLRLLNQIRDILIAEAHAAFPHECCGILLGNGTQITAAIPAKNVHPDPETHFEIDPQTLIDAHRAERQGGPEIAGYYHSHPNGLARPSDTDRKSAAHDGKIWAIIGDGEVTFWRDHPAGFAALSYSLSGG